MSSSNLFLDQRHFLSFKTATFNVRSGSPQKVFPTNYHHISTLLHILYKNHKKKKSLLDDLALMTTAPESITTAPKNGVLASLGLWQKEAKDLILRSLNSS